MEHVAKLESLIHDRLKEFKNQAKKHRRLHRGLWFASTVTSLAVAYSSNFTFAWGSVTSANLAGIFGILLPAITGYIMLRSPEKLWIFETEMRNRLYRLQDKIALAEAGEAQLDSVGLQNEYLKIMEESNTRWVEIKNG